MITAAPGSAVTGADLGHCLQESASRQELLLNRLADRSLAKQTFLRAPAGDVLASFSLHDLVHLFATEQRDEEEPDDDVRQFRYRFVERLNRQLVAITGQEESAELTGEIDPARFHAAERMAETEKWLDLATDLSIGLYVLYKTRKELDSIIEINEVRVRLHMLRGQPDEAARICLINADDLRRMQASRPALAAAQQARQIAQDHGLAARTAEADFKISLIMGDLKDWKGALEAGSQAVAEITKLGRESAAIGAAMNNCTFALLMGDRAAALEWARRAVEIAGRWGSQSQKASAALRYGRAQELARNYSAAIESRQQARMLWEAERHWWNAAMSCTEAAWAANSAHDMTTAAHMLGSATDYWERGKHLPQLLESLINLSAWHAQSHSFEQAEATLDRASKAASDSPEPPPLMQLEIQVRQEVVRAFLNTAPSEGRRRRHQRRHRRRLGHEPEQKQSGELMNERVRRTLRAYLSGDTDVRDELRHYIEMYTWNEPHRKPILFHEEFSTGNAGRLELSGNTPEALS